MSAQSDELRIGRTRWLQAQEYEQAFWQRLGDEHRSRYQRAARLVQMEGRAARTPSCLAPRRWPQPAARVLEIGSGPIGIVNFLEWGERYAIDPLEHFYRTQPPWSSLRNRGVTYLDGTGEQLPFEDASCSLVIIDNVIDHTYAPAKILQEIQRVLAPDGRLYLSVNVHTHGAPFSTTCWPSCRIDKGHPFTFTSQTLRRLLAAHSS